MDTLYTFWDNITHYETESVHFLGLMNSATKIIDCLLNPLSWKVRVPVRVLYRGFRRVQGVLNACFFFQVERGCMVIILYGTASHIFFYLKKGSGVLSLQAQETQ